MQEEKLILPIQYSVFAFAFSEAMEYNNDSPTCLTCKEPIQTQPPFRIQTVFDGDIGSFCSEGCSELMAGSIAHSIPLKSPSRFKLPPLCMYKNPQKLAHIIRTEKSQCYGTQQRLSDGKTIVIVKKTKV